MSGMPMLFFNKSWNSEERLEE